MISTDPLIWIGVFLTLCILSFLWKENYFYRFAEYTYIGVAVGNAFLTSFNSLQSNAIGPIMRGDYGILLMLLFALSIVLQPFNNYRWVARYPNAILIGVGTGVFVVGTMGSDILGLSKSLIAKGVITDPVLTLQNYLIIIGTISVLVYFFFTVKHTALKGTVGFVSKIGRYFMMISFGATFGNVILSRFTILFSRIVFLFSTWLGIV